jgi:hypothetical protein
LLRTYALCLLLALAALAALIAAHADSPPQPIPAEGKCAVPVDPTWTKQEQFVWLNVCGGKEANFNNAAGFGGNLDPKSPTGLPESRILRPSFLETILLKDEYRNALTRLGVHIIGARFTEPLNLQNAELQHDLWLDRSLLENGANLSGAETKRQMAFDHSRILGTFNAAGAQIDKDLYMRGAEFRDNINLSEAHVGGQLVLDGSTVKGPLDMGGIHVGENLSMENAQFQGIHLYAAHIGRDLGLTHSTVTGFLNMGDIRIDQNLYMGWSQFSVIALAFAHIGQLNMIVSTVTGQLNMHGIHVDQGLYMYAKAQFKEILLAEAHVGLLDMDASTVAGTLNMDDIRVDENLLMEKAQFEAIYLIAAHISGQLSLKGSTVTGQLESAYINVEQTVYLGYGAKFTDKITLRSAKLGQDLDLSGGTFNRDVDLTGAQIGGDLGLKSAQWLGSASLNLTGAAAGEIDLSYSWPDKIHLNGLTYHNLSNISPNISQQAKSWLGKQDYAPQPYEQLASVLQSNGRIEDATKIRYAGKEQERKTTPWGLYRFWLGLLDWSIGFGYYLQFAFYWAVGFVLLGWAVLYFTGQRTKHGITLGLVYSFDMLLPLVQLSKKHDDVELDPWPQRYFYAHKIIGVILASFIAAGITGLTK